MEKKKILLLPVSAGTGHIQVGKALEEELRERYPDKVEVRNVDVLDLGNFLLKTVYSYMYDKISKDMPDLYSYVYRGFNVEKKFSIIHKFFDRINALDVFREIAKYSPHVVLSLHPLSIDLIEFWKKFRKKDIKHFALVTDYEGHGLWVNERVDGYFVASDISKAFLMYKGIPENKIHLTGMPVRKSFLESISEDRKKELFKLYKLNPENRVALIVMSSLDQREATSLVELFLEKRNRINYVIVTGKNKAAYRALHSLLTDKYGFSRDSFGIIKDEGFAVLGYADNMNELMDIATVIVSKAGGITLSEALVKELPFIVIKPIPGQEQENSDFILENCIGLRVNNIELLDYKLQNLIYDDDKLLDMKNRIKKLKKPNATREVAEILVNA